jgi:hypothetical protein
MEPSSFSITGFWAVVVLACFISGAVDLITMIFYLVREFIYKFIK